MSEPAPQNPPETGASLPGQVGNDAGEKFKPGNRANPGGRPRGLARKVREILGEDDGETIARFWAAVMSGEIVTISTDPETGARVEERTKVGVKDRIEVSKLLAERGWGKPPQFAPIEEDDPLGMAEHAAAEAAESLDARIDDLAKKRNEREQAAAAAQQEGESS